MKNPSIITNRSKGEMYFLPPESFLEYYSLLVEACYLTRRPEPEVKTGELRRGGFRIPIRDWQAYKKLKQVDKSLYRLRYDIAKWLNEAE